MYRDNFKKEQEDKTLVEQYENMLAEGGIGFFEKHDFTKLIDYYEREDQTKQALDVVEHALIQHPYSATFIIRKAQFFMDENREPEALKLLEQAELFDATDMDIYLLRADILSSYHRFEEALSTLDYAKIRMSKSDMDELHLAYANVFEDMEDYDKMFNALAAALRFDKKNEEALERIWLCVELGKKHKESIELHNQILDENAYSYWAWFNLGQAYIGIGEYEKAAEAFDFAFTVKPSFELAYHNCAEAWMYLDNYPAAIHVLREGLGLFPKSFEFCMLAGNCYEVGKEFRQAKNFYIKAAKIDGRSGKAFFHLGECYAHEERWVHALSAYENSMRLENKNPKFIAAVAEAHYQLDNNVTADEMFKEALVIDTDNSDLWVQYLSFLIALEAYNEAYEAIIVAEEYCDDLEIKCCKIAAFYYHKHRKEALLLLQKLVAENKENSELLFELFPDLKEEQPILLVVL